MGDKALQRLAWLSLLGTFCLAIVRTFFGKGGTLISGVGNSGNRIMTNDVVNELASALAAYENAPTISDDSLNDVFAALMQKAKSGDLEAVLLLLKVAERQRD